MKANLLFKIRRTLVYRKIRLQLYYLFEYKKYKKKQENIIAGRDNTYSYLRKYKNIHNGERCFIIATGPSLAHTDFSALKHEYTFGVNALCMKFKEMGWKTNYFALSDYNAYKKMSPILTEEKMNFFCTWFTKDNPYCVFVPTFIHNCYMVDYNKKIYTKDIESGIGDGNTVVLQAIQIAAYMGFKDIYLLGVDCNYDLKEGELYFVDHGIRIPLQQGAGPRMIADFSVINRFAKEWGVNIYNASNGGMLEVFPRVNLKDIIKEG